MLVKRRVFVPTAREYGPKNFIGFPHHLTDTDFQFLEKEPKVSPYGVKYEDGTAATAAQMTIFLEGL